jgi:hypothetical protein
MYKDRHIGGKNFGSFERGGYAFPPRPSSYQADVNGTSACQCATGFGGRPCLTSAFSFR